jgi:hypothetical protein
MLVARSIGCISRAVLTAALVLASLVPSSFVFAQTPAGGQGKVKIEWLGHEFYRLTSPKGVVEIHQPLARQPGWARWP